MRTRDRWLLLASLVLLVYSSCGAWEAQAESMRLADRQSDERAELDTLEHVLRRAEMRLADAPPPATDSGSFSAIQILRRAGELRVTVERIAAVGNGYRLTVSGTLEHVLAISGGMATELSLTRRSGPNNVFEAAMTLSPGASAAIPATPDGIRGALRRLRIPETATRTAEQDSAAEGHLAALFQARGMPPAEVTAVPVVPMPILREQTPTEPPFDFLGQIQIANGPASGVLKSRGSGVIASVARGGRLEDWTLIAITAETATLRNAKGIIATLSRHR